jgi:hypothetical protein
LPESPAQLTTVGIDITKGILAVKLGISESEIPNDLSGLKSFIESQLGGQSENQNESTQVRKNCAEDDGWCHWRRGF